MHRTPLSSAILAVAVFTATTLAMTGLARAGDGSVVSWGAEFDTNARYLWRGIECDHGPVFQPSAWMSAGRYTLSAWSSLSNHQEIGPSACKELDLTFQADLGNEMIGIQPSFLYYHYYYDGVTPSTGEMSLRISRSIGSFEAYTAQTFDVVRYGGSYFGETGVDFESKIVRGRCGLSAALSTGWGSRRFNDVYIGASKTALNLAASSIGVRFPAEGNAYVRAHVEAAAILDPAIRSALGSTPSNAGIAMGIEF
jgi:hypothetical protein